MKTTNLVILALCIAILVLVLYKKSIWPIQSEGFQSQIPYVVYVTWHTKELPPFMNQNVEKLKRDNPEFSVQLFDDKDCREFIQSNFDAEVLNAYDTLIPGAYKADLWRYCVLYKNGGIYMDIKQSCVDGFKLLELTGNEQFVKDKIPDAYYNALMVAKQGSEYMKKCIEGVVINVKNRYYGINELDQTGPVFMYRIARENRIIVNAPMQFTSDGKYITLFGRNIVHAQYPEYRMEQKLFQKTKHYADLWRQGTIYNI